VIQNHSGDLFGGHYTADALHEPTAVWHHFDDSSTREVC
jgi:ubiquitin C-terminal hydrolase